MKYLVFDIEGDGLLDTISQLYCMVYAKIQGDSLIFGETTDINEIVDILNSEIYRQFRANNVEIPYSKQDLYIKELPSSNQGDDQ